MIAGTGVDERRGRAPAGTGSGRTKALGAGPPRTVSASLLGSHGDSERVRGVVAAQVWACRGAGGGVGPVARGAAADRAAGASCAAGGASADRALARGPSAVAPGSPRVTGASPGGGVVRGAGVGVAGLGTPRAGVWALGTPRAGVWVRGTPRAGVWVRGT